MGRAALTARGQWLRIALAVPALAAIFAAGQLDLDRLGWRWDLTPEQRYTLSPRAREVLRGLDTDVRALAFLRAHDPRTVVISDLLHQMEAATPRVHAERVDVNRAPALAREYGVEGVAVALEAGGRRRLVSNPSEDTLVAGLLALTHPTPRVLGWVVGHGEGDLENADRRGGFAVLRRLLGDEQYTVRPVNLGGAGVPQDLDALVVMGPHDDFLPEELAALNGYLQRPGRAVVLLDPLRAPQLARFLSRYQIAMDDEVVIDPSGRMYGGEALTMRLIADRGGHAIVAPLVAPPLFSRARPVRAMPGADEAGVLIEPLLFSSRESWSTPDTTVLRTGTGTFVEGRDQRGPVCVGVAATFPVLRGPGEAERRGRLVVYGDSDFADNFFIDFLGNKDLILNTMAWVSEDRASLTHRPEHQKPGVNQFYVTGEQGDRVFWLSVIVQPSLFLAAGLVLALRRRWS